MMFSQAVTTLSVRDLDASIAFYRGVLGFTVVHRLNREIVHLAGAGMVIAIRQRDFDTPASESANVHIGLMVPDLAEVQDYLESRGVSFLGEPVDADVAKVSFFNDPDGTPLYLCQWSSWRDTSTRRSYDLAAF